jgi:hypothetical protein
MLRFKHCGNKRQQCSTCTLHLKADRHLYNHKIALRINGGFHSYSRTLEGCRRQGKISKRNLSVILKVGLFCVAVPFA